jgi:hypothetical protein
LWHACTILRRATFNATRRDATQRNETRPSLKRGERASERARARERDSASACVRVCVRGCVRERARSATARARQPPREAECPK